MNGGRGVGSEDGFDISASLSKDGSDVSAALSKDVSDVSAALSMDGGGAVDSEDGSDISVSFSKEGERIFSDLPETYWMIGLTPIMTCFLSFIWIVLMRFLASFMVWSSILTVFLDTCTLQEFQPCMEQCQGAMCQDYSWMQFVNDFGLYWGVLFCSAFGKIVLAGVYSQCY